MAEEFPPPIVQNIPPNAGDAFLELESSLLTFVFPPSESGVYGPAQAGNQT